MSNQFAGGLGMLFNSFEFLVFLPVVFALYWFVFKKRKPQNALIVLASYVFYGWWDWKFLFLIAFTSLCSFLSGLLIGKNEGNQKRQKWISAANIVVNPIYDSAFKYMMQNERAATVLLENLLDKEILKLDILTNDTPIVEEKSGVRILPRFLRQGKR